MSVDLIVLVMAGGGAAGKSTTTKAFAQGEPEEFKDKKYLINTKGEDVEEIVHWTIYDNCASCGNHHSGTDSNKGPHTVRAAFYECVDAGSDIIIVDGYTSSPRWIDMVNEYVADNPTVSVEVLCVHFKLSPEELLSRLARRREVHPDTIREKYLPTRAGVGRRGDNIVRYFEERCTAPVSVIEVLDHDSTEEIVGWIDEEIAYIFGDGDDEE